MVPAGSETTFAVPHALAVGMLYHIRVRGSESNGVRCTVGFSPSDIFHTGT